MANDVNATGIVGTNGLSVGVHQAAAEHVRAAGVALVEDDHADAPAACGVEHLHAEVAVPRWISAIRARR